MTKLSERATTRTLCLASLGGALEFYDFVIFVFFTASIGRLFFPPELPAWSRQLQTYGLFAAGYLARPLGGLVMAHFGDTRGRKRVFTLSIALMAIPTFFISLLPTYKVAGVAAPVALLLLRLVQGAAIGGEAPGGWVFVAEHARSGRIGLAVGMLTSRLSLGILLGSVVATCVNTSFTQAQIDAGWWRVPFALGGLLGLAAAFLRRWLSETPVFLSMQQRAAKAASSSPLENVIRSHAGAIIRGLVLTSFLTAMVIVTILLTPSLLHQLFHVPVAQAQIANLFGTIGLCISAVLFGWASDLVGVRWVAWVTVPGSFAATYLLFAMAREGGVDLNGWYFLAGLGAGCSVLAPIMLLRLFTPQVRFTGFALSYNLAYAVFGGVTPIIVLTLSGHDVFAAPYYVAFGGILGLSALSLPVGEWEIAI